MAGTSSALVKHSWSSDHISQTIFDVHLDSEKTVACLPYFDYYKNELGLLRRGVVQANWQTATLAVQNDEDISHVIGVVRSNTHLARPEIRGLLLAKFQTASSVELNRSIDLTLRLWLMLNFQDTDFEGLRHEATCVAWNDSTTLQEHIHALFPVARWPIDGNTSRLGPYFTAVFMHNVCGMKIEWTTSLCDHLRLDRRQRIVWIFPYKCHIEQLIANHESGRAQSKCVFMHKSWKNSRLIDGRPPIPLDVLQETLMTLDLLFPFWDGDTVTFLERKKQTFHETGPFTNRNLTLMDLNHWRDRILELREVLDTPPVSWAQLWRDRRNPQQFWTFWIALFILLLTILSFITSVIQAWASLKALGC